MFLDVDGSQIWLLRPRGDQTQIGRRCACYLSPDTFAVFYEPVYRSCFKVMTNSWIGFILLSKISPGWKNWFSEFEWYRFLWGFQDGLNRAWDVLLPTNLPIFPEFPNHFCTHFSCVNVRSPRNLVWMFFFSVIFKELNPHIFFILHSREGGGNPTPHVSPFLNYRRIVVIIGMYVTWLTTMTSLLLVSRNWDLRKVCDVRKKWKTNILNLDFGQKMASLFYFACSCPNTLFFLFTTKSCANESSSSWSKSELKKKSFWSTKKVI